MQIKEFLSWWFWRRWNIYCPKYPISHLFISEEHGLFDYNEHFISPCVFNSINNGVLPKNKCLNKISFIGMILPEE